MRDYREIYRSKTGTLPERLAEEVFVNNANPQVIKEDRLFSEGLHEVLTRDQIPLDSTYFVVDIGHAHLVGIGVELLKKGVDVAYFIPSKANGRLPQAVAYHADENLEAKTSIGVPIGFATLLDLHRNDYNDMSMRYTLPENVLPTATELRKLGIKRVVHLSERSVEGENYPASIVLATTNPSGFKDRFLEYQKAGIELHFRGIDRGIDKRQPMRSILMKQLGPQVLQLFCKINQ